MLVTASGGMQSGLFACSLATAFLVSLHAHAETWQAPVGGNAIALGPGRVACAGTSGDWSIEQDGHSLRPPTGNDAIGRAVDARIALSKEACATAPAPITLVAIGRSPAIDASATTLFVDGMRVDLRGRGLKGAVVRWHIGDRSGVDRCVQPQPEAGAERCVVAVGHGLPADPTEPDLDLLPAGARFGTDVVTWDASGRRVAADEMVLRPARVVVDALVPSDVTIDLAGGTSSRIPLVHPEAVTGADCGAASCTVSGSVVVVGGLASVSNSLAVRLRLAPGVVMRRADTLDAAPLIQVPVLPCAMSMASGDAIRGVDATRAVVRVEARCAAEAGSLRWFSAGRMLDVLSVFDGGGAAYVLLGVGRVEGNDLVITATRAGPDGSTVGQARARTRGLPPPRASLVLDGGQSIDFVPTNRPALIRWAKIQGAGELALLPLEGIYTVQERDGAMRIQGERGAGGFVAMRFAWRVPTLPGPLAAIDLAIVADPVELPMHEANVAVPLGASAMGPRPLVDLVCGAGPTLRRLAPGRNAHVPFDERDACRVIFHQERLSPSDGAQKLQLEVEVTRVDGTTRPEAHVSQTVVMRASDQPRIAWIKGIVGSFDRATLRVSHAGDDYVDRADQQSGEPSIQWSVVFGTGHFRLYATTAIPTGLYRVSDRQHSGILLLNFGALMRATWLDGEGHEGFLGLEAGVMAEGLTNDKDSSGNSLTQVATVTGIGISVPIANRSLATETSINLHAWFEYEVSRALGNGTNGTGSPIGFVFGPSLSIGNIGMNL
jgi:hypothetical protein